MTERCLSQGKVIKEKTPWRTLFWITTSLFLIFIFLSGVFYFHYWRHPQHIHLDRYYHFTQLMRDPSVDCDLRHFRSGYDGKVENIFIMRPAAGAPQRLFFFFHGMDGDCGDAVVVRDLVTKLGAQVVSLGGRGPSWVSDAFLADATQVIAEFTQKKEGYYLIGISMGGTQTLVLPGVLPPEVAQLLRGVIALIPGADLPDIARNSSNAMVRQSLKTSVDNDMAKLEQRSPHHLLNKIGRSVPLVIFYDQDDKILPVKGLEDYIARLKETHPLSVFQVPGDHHFTYSSLDYQRLFAALGKKLVEKLPSNLYK